MRYNHDTMAHGNDNITIQRFCDNQYISRKSYNDTSRYLSKKNACEKVKCKFSFFIQVQTVRKQQKSSVNQF